MVVYKELDVNVLLRKLIVVDQYLIYNYRWKQGQ